MSDFSRQSIQTHVSASVGNRESLSGSQSETMQSAGGNNVIIENIPTETSVAASEEGTSSNSSLEDDSSTESSDDEAGMRMPSRFLGAVWTKELVRDHLRISVDIDQATIITKELANIVDHIGQAFAAGALKTVVDTNNHGQKVGRFKLWHNMSCFKTKHGTKTKTAPLKAFPWIHVGDVLTTRGVVFTVMFCFIIPDQLIYDGPKFSETKRNYLIDFLNDVIETMKLEAPSESARDAFLTFTANLPPAGRKGWKKNDCKPVWSKNRLTPAQFRYFAETFRQKQSDIDVNQVPSDLQAFARHMKNSTIFVASSAGAKNLMEVEEIGFSEVDALNGDQG